MRTRLKTKTGSLIPLESAIDESQSGGKASHLAALIGSNYSVPAGMVITVASFTAFLEENAIGATIQRMLDDVNDDPQSLAGAAEEIRALVMACRLPSDLQAELAEEKAALRGWGTLAVRSSARGEDSGHATFAGQLETTLNVLARDLGAAILSCWASYWSAPVLAYQRRRNVALQGMAVILQQQVESAFSGVLFSRSPDDAEASVMAVEFCEGLGERLVDGSVDPARILITRSSCEWRWGPGSGERAPECRALMNDALAAQLHDIGLSLEQQFAAPQDIEWTVDTTGQLHVLQTRPITAYAAPLPPHEKTEAPEVETRGEVTVWSNANVNENYPDPISPLLYSIAARGYYHYFRNLGIALGVSPARVRAMEPALRQLIGVHRGRLYYNLTSIHAVLRAAPGGEWLTGAFNLFVGAQQTDAAGTLASRSWRVRCRDASEGPRMVWTSWRRFRRLKQGVRHFENEINGFAARTHPAGLTAMTQQQLYGHLQEFMEIRCHRWTEASLADAASMISYGLWKRLVQREFPESEYSALHNSLLKGLRDVVSGEPIEALWAMSRTIRADPELLDCFESMTAEQLVHVIESDARFAAFHGEFVAFQEAWGFRCSGELMLTVASYQEQPAELFKVLQHYAAIEDESPLDRRRVLDGERQEETRVILSQLRGRRLFRAFPWPRKSWLAAKFLAWTQDSIALRERARLKQSLLYSRCRRIALELGRHLAASGRLQKREDVWMLTIDELCALASGCHMFPEDVGRITAVRRAAHQRFVASAPPPDRLELPNGEYLADDASVATRAPEPRLQFSGEGVCGGQARGRAVVLHSSTEIGRLKPGDILVTRQTDPGWGPILFLVKGLVIERGGMLSHGAILAREYGIPTVVGIQDASRLIQDGKELLVDGDRGLVEISD